VIRALPLVLLVVLVLAVGSWAIGGIQASLARRPSRRGSVRTGGYEFEGRLEALRRRRADPTTSVEQDPAMEEFVRTHAGVEAYVEPETVVSPRSVVLVDAAGEWRRFSLQADRPLQRLSAERGVPIFDAARTGYPPRMRRRPGPET
jgi:hypothetical protein